MGLFQKAAETYDYMESYAGEEFEDKIPLAPIGFITTGVRISITLSKDGEFEKAEELFAEKEDKNGKLTKDEKKLIIPVTEASAGRTSSSAKVTPHPLCDKFMFMCPEYKDSYESYIAQLEEWCNSEFSVPQIKAVLKYVKKGKIRYDTASVDKVKEDDFVCWRVRASDSSEEEDIWRNKAVIDSYVKYCQRKVGEKSDKALCYVSGEMLPVAEQHQKGVVSYYSNAKLISSKDDKLKFKYKGRFKDDKEALTVSFISSQKAHNALKWVVANYGVGIGNRTAVCWNPKGKQIPRPTSSLFSEQKAEKATPSNYRQVLSETVLGYKNSLEPDDETVTAVFSATQKNSGRLSVSYYSEMKASDFLERLRYWDETTAWEHRFLGVTSPDLRRIVDAAYGNIHTKEKEQSIETDEKIAAEIMERLLLCRLEKSPFPYVVMQNAVNKCSSLQLYDDSGKNNRMNQVFTTCAIIKKYRYDHFKEEWNMALEPEKKDRSYQYGRLLAVMEKAERDTYKKDEKRETNAIRLQSAFTKRPMYISKIIIEQLKNAYYPRLSVRAKSDYDKLIGEIMVQLSDYDDREINRPLDEAYLMGYYLQRNAFYTQNNENNNGNETEDNEQ